MKILFDHQTFSLQDYGGVSRIYVELLKGSSDYPTLETKLSVLISNNENLKELPKQKWLSFLRGSNWRYKRLVMMKLNQFFSIIKIKYANFDVFHPTYYYPYFLQHLKGRPFVVTFFDMIHEKFAEIYPEFRNDVAVHEGKKKLLKAASKIIAISYSTKNDIIEYYGIDPDKIVVIYLGSSMPKIDKGDSFLVKENYILFVGNRGFYKNFIFFLKSIANLLSDTILVCAGGGQFTEVENEVITSLGLQTKVKFVPIKSDEMLANLYSGARCFVFPSLYEGFGIPILEAFSCGCPCILSDRSSLPEVAGDGAIYFNPENADSIYNAVSCLINNEQARMNLVEKGYEKLTHFSWERTRFETYKLYESLV